MRVVQKVTGPGRNEMGFNIAGEFGCRARVRSPDDRHTVSLTGNVEKSLMIWGGGAGKYEIALAIGKLAS